MTAIERLAEIRAELDRLDGNGELSLSEAADMGGIIRALVTALEAVLEATSKRHGPEVSQQYETAMETIEDIINEALGEVQ